MKRLDRKLARIAEGNYKPTDFIIADAKDGDMSGGAPVAGYVRDGQGKPTDRCRPIKDYRDDMERMIESDLVDIMLTSLSTAEYLTQRGAYAKNKEVTPAIRLNDGTHIWTARHSGYGKVSTFNFRSARLDRVKPYADLGLYAVDFFNDPAQDIKILEEYARFRDEASRLGVRHFLEVFNPKFNIGLDEAQFAAYNNDMIIRCLAGVSRFEYPLFLKMEYNGPRALEELAAYDPGKIIVGVLGGSASTNRDTLELVKQVEHYGARVALFGRRIYHAEDSLSIVRAMRKVIEEGISSQEATKYYHDELKKLGKSPYLPLEQDLELTDQRLKSAL